MFTIYCPVCQTEYELDESYIGRKVMCHQCKQRFLITEQGPAMQETPLAMELVSSAQGPPPQETMHREEMEDDVPAHRPMPRRRSNRRKEPKSHALPVIVISLTVFVVLGVVVLSVYLIIRAFSHEDDKQSQHATYPTIMDERARQMQQQRQGPDLGEMADRPANFDLKSLNDPDSQFQLIQPTGPIITADDLPGHDDKKPQITTARIKQSTVFIRVDREDGGGTGSGFFAFEPGLVVTNAHVVDMMRPSNKVPKNIEVVVNSGETNEYRLKANLIAVDRLHDLALLRVKGDQLPPPMPILSSTQIEETQSVTVAGFPLASQVGKNISLRTATVSSLRKENGRLTTVQVSGGMNPGNSGGPVVDTQGRVVGVSVSILGNRPDFTESSTTDFCFAVPTDYVYELYYGHVHQLIVLPSSAQNDQVLVPVVIRLSDAMNRIQEVAVEWWFDEPGDPLPGSMGDAPPSDGKQLNRPKVVLEKKRIGAGKSQAMGELTIPPVPEGKALWLQVITKHQGLTEQTRRHSAHPVMVRPLLLREPLAKSPEKRDILDEWEINQSFHTRVRSERGEFNFSPIKLSFQNKFLDLDPDPNAGMKYDRKVTDIQVGAQIKGEPLNYQTLSALLMGSASGSIAGLDQSALKPYQQVLFNSLCHLPNTMRAWDFSLPEGEVELDQTWKRSIRLPLYFVVGRVEIPNIDITCRYLGKMKVNGLDVAVVTLQADFIPTSQSPSLGSLVGIAHIDLETGHLSYLHGLMDLEVERAALNNNLGNMMMVESYLIGKLEFQIKRKGIE